MGNEEDRNERKKILTNKSSFNKSNCREIFDSDSEIESAEKIKKDLSKQLFSGESIGEEYEIEEEEEEKKMSKNQINNNNQNNSNNNNNDLNYIEYTFIWKEGGKEVKLVGSFNNWKEKKIMKKDSKDNFFKYKMKLKKDKYEYKFIVDDVWKFSEQQGKKSDGKGNTNNYIDLTNYKISKKNINKSIKKKKKAKKIKKEEQKKAKIDSFGLYFPQKEDLNTEAPNAQELYIKSFDINDATNQKNIGEGQYFKYINRESCTEEKSYKNLLYSPHVNLNHTITFCEQKKILQVGLTYRFRNKDCTIVYYSRL